MTRVRVESRSYDRGCRKNDAQTLSTTPLTILLVHLHQIDGRNVEQKRLKCKCSLHRSFGSNETKNKKITESKQIDSRISLFLPRFCPNPITNPLSAEFRFTENNFLQPIFKQFCKLNL